MKSPAVCLIIFYRKFISPLKPDSCRFYPSCSQYAEDAIIKYGFFKGAPRAFLRLLRCTPLNKGGFDPLR